MQNKTIINNLLSLDSYSLSYMYLKILTASNFIVLISL